MDGGAEVNQWELWLGLAIFGLIFGGPVALIWVDAIDYYWKTKDRV